MKKVKLAPGCWCVEIPEVDFSILCGCPENAVKFLYKSGCVRTVEAGGTSYEKGPNGILLSDVSIQNGTFCNLGEFPVLHMLYLQGMIVPGHPNNTGRRPLVIGLADQVEAQSRYIFAGNYGLSSVDEMVGAGLDPETAHKFFRMKLAFAFGHIRPTDELLDLRPLGGDAVLLAPGLFLHRLSQNVYEFLFGGHSLEVDLNLAAGEAYGAPYHLPYRPFTLGGFSVVHLGDGDGWDVARPCTGSLLVHGDELSLVDAGPNLAQGLAALGTPVSQIARLFHTHGHDDHFVGLTALLRSERRVIYHAVPWVRASVVKKFQALTGLGADEFNQFFDVQDLVPDVWNDLGGLEVLPLFSPHPVETTIFHFRVKDHQGGYHTYAHLADLTSFSVLDSFVQDDETKPGLSTSSVARAKAEYLLPADVKKIDIGGGMIHGNASDFASDASSSILLSHTGRALTIDETRVGHRPEFGSVSVLIPGPPQSVSPVVPEQVIDVIRDLIRSALFAGHPVSSGLVSRLVTAARQEVLPQGIHDPWQGASRVWVVIAGTVRLTYGTWFGEVLGPGGVFGEDSVLFRDPVPAQVRTEGPVRLLSLDAKVVGSCPLLLWSLRERFDRRMVTLETSFGFDWYPEYAVGVRALDGQHRRLFSLIEGIRQAVVGGAGLAELLRKLDALTRVADFHFETEQRLMVRYGYPALGVHSGEHGKLALGIRRCAEDLRRSGLPPQNELMEFLKVWLLRHTLLEDRQYIHFFQEKGVA